MLPSLGLFKSILCPYYPNCSRNPCLYSHTKQEETRKHSSPAQLANDRTKKQRIENTPDKKQHIENTSDKKHRIENTPAKKQVEEKRNDKSVSSLQETAVKRTLDLPKKTKMITPNSSVPTILNTTISNKEKRRVAHTSSSVLTGPPITLPNLNAPIPLKVRLLIASKMYEQFKRIYEPLLSLQGSLATDHSIKQEGEILKATSNLAGYKQKATSVLMHLKKRPVSVGMEDIGIDGEWKDPSEVQEETLSEEDMEKSVISLDFLKQLNYPLMDTLENPSEAPTDLIGSIRLCDRCNQDYMIKDILEEGDMEVCQYHSGRLRTAQVNGEKLRIYTCCEDPLGSAGCKRGPHVYKDEDTAILHQKIPYVRAPPRDPSNNLRQTLVALDCEMGYTTAGMELIRLTVVDSKMKVLLDELVLPSHMIIDLNSHYSGVKTLEGVKHDLSSLRKELFKYVDQDTIILGHGLENDMNALRLVHERIIDTVSLYPHPHGLPYRHGLRYLVSRYLHKFIQTGSDGHDSFEDARSCIELLEYYLKNKKSKENKNE
ncbi:hypothetical protein BDB01DRAFT_847763 [Pilobolus umbonatus]|nr:hypothetical protein BDB01DRAFT_847763 [Pilobolus umbonatus]